MTPVETRFLELVRAGLHGEKPADPALSDGEWKALMELAEAHKLLPLVYDVVCELPAFLAYRGRSTAPAEGAASDWKLRAVEQLARQVRQENEFLNLILALRARGLEPLVLKGCVCRALYPKPLLRPSLDDDLLIPPEQGRAYREALLELGLEPDEPDADPESAWELDYRKPGSPLYLELHQKLFDPDSELFRAFNLPFEDAPARAVAVQIQDVRLRTLAPADHLLYQLLHAFKHFLYSGFGLRIISDICLFSQRYADEIDFEKLAALCAARRCERFAAALYRIGEKDLGIPTPAPFAALDADEAALRQDVLDSGLHGDEIDRLHSARITLRAVSEGNAGQKRAGGLRLMLFPGRKQLSARYPWLEKRPWLLPAAWLSRLAVYLKQRGRYGAESPAAALRIGRDRVRLLEQYGIIDSGRTE